MSYMLLTSRKDTLYPFFLSIDSGIRYANISEPAKGLVLNSAQVKTMTGRDSMTARFLHENSFTFLPQFKLFINANHLPIITDRSVFDSERVKVIPFERHFKPEERDHTLKSEFKKKKVQSAILNWLLDGYKMLVDEGLTLPSSVSAATNDYSYDSDKVGRFVEEMLEKDDDAEVKTAVIYAAYQKWCRRNGVRVESSGNLNNSLRAYARIERRRPRDGGSQTTILYGYRLIELDSGKHDFDGVSQV